LPGRRKREKGEGKRRERRRKEKLILLKDLKREGI